MSADFVAHMEDVLDLYAEPYDPQRPVVCFDETSTQLLAETQLALPPRPGLPLRQDYEYRREGTRNLFLACEPLAGWREVAVTERRTMQDFARRMRWLADEAYPEAEVVKLHELLLAKLRQRDRIDWSRAVVDSASIRAVGSGGKNRAQSY